MGSLVGIRPMLGRALRSHGRLRPVSHPSLGLPPRDLKAGDAVAADALLRAGERLRVRALEAALALDPTLRDRYDDLTRQALLSDLVAFVDRLAVAVASDDPRAMATFADMIAVRYRKRRIAMDDVVLLCEGLRRASAGVVEAAALPVIDAAIDQAIAVFRWHRRLAGDARKRNPLLAFIYKGA
jgi:hypothetical protein